MNLDIIIMILIITLIYYCYLFYTMKYLCKENWAADYMDYKWCACRETSW